MSTHSSLCTINNEVQLNFEYSFEETKKKINEEIASIDRYSYTRRCEQIHILLNKQNRLRKTTHNNRHWKH